MTNLKNPKEKIYLMLFEKPLNLTEISNTFYGKLNTKVSSYLTELESDGWIEYKRDYYRFKKGGKKDSRKSYYQSTSEGLFDSINNELNIGENKRKTLSDFLNSDTIRNLVISYVNYNKIFNSENIKEKFNHIKTIKQHIGLMCLYRLKIEEFCKKQDLNAVFVSETKVDAAMINKRPLIIDISMDEWKKLGKDLQKKLSYLAVPLVDEINFYYDRLISIVEGFYTNISVSKGEVTNGHGLS